MSVRNKINELISALKEMEEEDMSEIKEPKPEDASEEQVPPAPVLEGGLLSEEESEEFIRLRQELSTKAALLGNLLLEYEAQKKQIVESREKLVEALQEELQRIREEYNFPPEQSLEIGIHPEHQSRVYIKKS